MSKLAISCLVGKDDSAGLYYTASYVNCDTID